MTDRRVEAARDAARAVGRSSYRRLASLPAYGLYAGDRLVATIRAESAQDAADLFRRHGLAGVRVRRV